MITLICPACDQHLEATDDELAQEQITCPTCQRQWPPSRAKQIRQADPAKAPAVPATAAPGESDRIEDLAHICTGLSAICAIIGVVSLVIFIGGAIAGGNGGSVSWIIAIASLCFAPFLFLLAQIIYIRALLARKK